MLLFLEEAQVLLTPASGRDEEAKADQAATARIRDVLGRVVFAGRAAGVHVVISAQRGDAALLGPAVRDSVGLRLCMTHGAKDSTVELSLELPRTALVPCREPPVRIKDLPAPVGRVLVEDQSLGEPGLLLAQVSL